MHRSFFRGGPINGTIVPGLKWLCGISKEKRLMFRFMNCWAVQHVIKSRFILGLVEIDQVKLHEQAQDRFDRALRPSR